jgi:hypothetical protein
MKHGLTIAALALAVTGCGGAGSGRAQTVAQPPASDLPPAAASLPAPTSSELCDAHALSYLIGRPRTEIPVPVDTSRRVVACATCVAPPDYRPDRTEILFDARTGLVTAVKCG